MSVRLRADLPGSLVLVDGESFRIGQPGAFVRIPLGYTQLYGVCTQVGAAALPENADPAVESPDRWITVVLFGQSLGARFERGVSQYPTVGDEVHLVTSVDLAVIYGAGEDRASAVVGSIAGSPGIPARIDLSRLLARHCCVVGSTGSGKSNFVAVLLEAIADQAFPSARVLVIDPHGEYPSAIGRDGYVFRVSPDREDDRPLWVPFWALPFGELRDLALGELQPGSEAAIRDEIADMKKEAAAHLASAPPHEAITADSPMPFDIRRLWFKLDDYERRTLADRQTGEAAELVQKGDAATLSPNIYPPPGHGTSPPFLGPRRNISRQLELLRSRLLDARYAFLFSPGPEFSPSEDGSTQGDIDGLVASWVGHDRPLTVLDVSGLPSEAVSAIVGTLIRIVYDTLFWAQDLPVGGRSQPLLIVLEEAHLFLPRDAEGPAHRTLRRVAKEGRKYGVGLLVVTQRPTEIDPTILSQCGTMVSLRVTNSEDRSAVGAAMPDDLGGLASMLPSLRTGEGLLMGEAVPLPSRVMFRQAVSKPVGDDPDVASAWRRDRRPDPADYAEAVANWRSQSHQQGPKAGISDG